ncbi:CBS domain-containing protein [Thalassoglobus sp. JC818]|uniref:CBS domain-containing protein n=1 Tax=Thalassoglobus sp. JC818 TaxID=3232136 RepID=UPI0034583B12
MESQTVSEIMQSVPLSLLPETSSLRAEKILLLCQLPEVYVTSSEGALMGVVPDYIFLKNRIIERDIERPISELMVPVRLTARPGDNILKLACTLREHIHQRVPVVESGLLIGMVTRHAVLRTLVEAVLDCPEETVEPEASRRLPQNSIPTPHMKPERDDSRPFSTLAEYEST